MAQRSESRSEADKLPGGVGNGVAHGVNGEAKGSASERPNGTEVAASTAAPWRSYKEQIATLAGRIVDAQRPIRVLQALRWDPCVEEAFRRARYREMPRVTQEDYAKIELGFEPAAKIEEFEAIMQSIESELGQKDPIGRILHTTAAEYREVVHMLKNRGTREFYTYARKLYGSPKDKFPDGK